MQDKAELLIEVLAEIRRGLVTNPEATDRLHQAVLSLGSRTEDNLACVDHIEVSEIKDRLAGPTTIFGVAIRNKPIPIVDIIATLEGTPIPRTIREDFPDLTSMEWKACMRFVTLLLTAIDRRTY